MSTVLVQTPEAVTVSGSRRRDLRLVKVAKQPVYGAGGQKVNESPGQTIVFRDGILRVPADGDVTLEDGRKIPGSEVDTFLRGHHLWEDKEEGFFEVHAAVPPVSADEMVAITEAMAARDQKALVDILDAELGGWRRDAIIRAAEAGIQALATPPEPEVPFLERKKPGPKPKAKPAPEPEPDPFDTAA
jgi:hypothetical protein